MSSRPRFTSPGKVARVRIAAANTASDGSGTVAKFLMEDGITEFQGGANGSRLEKITVTNSQAVAAASTSMDVRMFLSDSTGANFKIHKEVAMTTQTRSVSAVGATFDIPLSGLDIGAGVKPGMVQSAYAGAQDQNDYILEYSDYTAE